MDDRELTATQRTWLTHVEACAAAGCSMKAYAEEHGLDLQSFYLWKGRLKKLGLVAGRPDQATPRLQVLPKHITAGYLSDLRHFFNIEFVFQ